MTVTVTHSTAPDDSFSETGAAAWSANHTLSGVGTMAEQDANSVAITGGAVDGAAIGDTTPSTGVFTTLDATSFATNVAAAGLTLSGTSLTADGTDTNINMSLMPKGNGGLGINGTPTGDIAGSTLTAKFCVKQNESGPVAGFVKANNSSAAPGSTIYGCRSRGTLTAPTVVQNNDTLISLLALGFDGTDLAQSAEIDFQVDGTPGANDMPGRIVFKTSPDGSQTTVEAMRIDSTQTVSIGKATVSTSLAVTGTTSFDGSEGTSGQVLTSQGTGNTPVWATPTTGSVTSVSGTAPIASTGGATPAISISQANTTTDGYLSSTDWNTFNNKQPAGSYLTAVTADAPLSGAGTSASHLVIAQASTTTDGYLSSTDWNTFNNKGSGTVTSVSATSPVTSTGGATPTIAIPAANTTTDGYLSSTDWNTFNNKTSNTGTVTSVGGTGTVNGLSLSGTVTTSGNLTLGGTLDLSSPPAIGGSTPAAITGTTITATNYVGIGGGAF